MKGRARDAAAADNFPGNRAEDRRGSASPAFGNVRGAVCDTQARALGHTRELRLRSNELSTS